MICWRQILQELGGISRNISTICGWSVAVASLPESYADRLTELFPRRFDRLRLFALDAHDLALFYWVDLR